MSSSKKFKITLSKAHKDDLINIIVNKESIKKYKKNSKLIKTYLIQCIKGKNKLNELKNGYKEMAEINLDICEMGFAEDMVVLKEYEAKLAESDLPDDNCSKKRRYILC
ncbi:hypothetical protein [Clostridium botulinum]|uniref:CopG family transcriptional regulator n=2 Tax=Clostridium botulinum TaxID=1491 RepID=A0A9Q1V057_CLOBO|nr:hypothetical protein [Clostridium botulinum]AEB75096.1 conserved protein [Clostridium botulinum BKT015925]KEH98894.1 hypothetical protein Z953_12285 [Clostridium botulinum D str. 16868]KEI05648.1 hypothetical protein Y848_05790 [Clostridium botulinum C/D str. Sp77]KEI06904.1 hypothetical protein Z952_02480 [Clostridium botulinum C/D str. BKT75002]KEI08200.1 hypothetical protein Z954_01645 [Clostridium botulinum C/D str. BKT2873]